MYVCAYPIIHTYGTCMHTSIHTHIHTGIHEYVHTCIHTYIMHTCIHVCIHIYTRYMRTCIHTCIHTYIDTCIHTYMYAYIFTQGRTYIIRTYVHTYTHTYVQRALLKIVFLIVQETLLYSQQNQCTTKTILTMTLTQLPFYVEQLLLYKTKSKNFTKYYNNAYTLKILTVVQTMLKVLGSNPPEFITTKLAVVESPFLLCHTCTH